MDSSWSSTTAGTNAQISLAPEAEHSVFVRQLFGQIAPRYRLMNRLMTGSLDTRWRRAMLDEAALPTGGLLLDLATGTGDVASLASSRDRSDRIVGLISRWR